MHCGFYFPLSSVECTAGWRSILDFVDEQADIFLSEIGSLRGQITRKYEIKKENCSLRYPDPSGSTYTW